MTISLLPFSHTWLNLTTADHTCVTQKCFQKKIEDKARCTLRLACSARSNGAATLSLTAVPHLHTQNDTQLHKCALVSSGKSLFPLEDPTNFKMRSSSRPMSFALYRFILIWIWWIWWTVPGSALLEACTHWGCM